MTKQELKDWNMTMNILIWGAIAMIEVCSFWLYVLFRVHDPFIEDKIFLVLVIIVAALFLFVPIQAKRGRNAYFRKLNQKN